jgi:hypothetical protein
MVENVTAMMAGDGGCTQNKAAAVLTAAQLAHSGRYAAAVKGTEHTLLYARIAARQQSRLMSVP